MQRASCPACGAPIVFVNAGSLAAVCGSCRSVIRKAGVDLERYGEVGAIREDASPFVVGTRGTHEGKRFRLVGRLQVMFLDGFWNEWHAAFDDGSFAWLAEAQGMLSIQRPWLGAVPSDLLSHHGVSAGEKCEVGGRKLVVANVGKARVVGGEGELPFPVDGGYALPFADLTSTGADCGTLDWSDDDPEPKVFLGTWVDFDALDFKELRETLPPDHPMAAVKDVQIEKIACPGCNGPLERKTGLNAPVLYCQYCGSGIDLTQEPYRIFSEQQWSGGLGGFLSLGDRVALDDVSYEVIAVLERQTMGGEKFRWSEYCCHHPRRGYRWLVESSGHFTWTRALPQAAEHVGKGARVNGKTYLRGESCKARVVRVAGELYFRVKAGDTAQLDDFANPPEELSAEIVPGEVTWSLGRYLDRAEVAAATGKPVGDFPKPDWVAPHQPAPQDRYLKPLLLRWVIAVGASILAIVLLLALAPLKVLAQEALDFEPPAAEEQKLQPSGSPPSGAAQALADKNVRWIGPFTVPRSGWVGVELFAPVSNAFIAYSLSLVDEDGGKAISFGGEVSNYADSDGSDGSNTASIIVPRVPAGSYTLRVEPMFGGMFSPTMAKTTVRVTQGGALFRWFLVGHGVLLLFVLVPLLMKMRFETRRKEDNSPSDTSDFSGDDSGDDS